MEYIIHILILISIYAMLGVSLNLVMGYTGLLSVTHAAFYGVGAYATALLMTQSGMNFFLTLIIGIFITGMVALLMGFVLSRFRGDYFALGSFGFNIIIFSIMLNWQELTRGPLGVPGIPRPSIFGFELRENILFLILALLFLAGIYALSRRLVNSTFGRVLQGIREDEGAVQVFGYQTDYFKLMIFVISAMMASVAGSLYATYIAFVDPSTFTLLESIFLLSIVILGGLASNRGAVLGAALLLILPELLRFVGFPPDIAAQMRQAVYGLLLILLMMYRPQGILGKFKL